MICNFNASRRAGAPLCALAGARRRARPPPLRFEGPARPPLPCVLGCLKNTTLFDRGCLIFVLWLYRMICYFNASRREGASASSLRLRCPLCVRRRWRSSCRCPPPPLCALAGARRRARPPPLRLRFASKDPPARLCRVSVGVLYLFCGCFAPHPPAPGLSASGVLAALGAVGGRPGAAPPGAGGMVRNVLNS